MTNLNSGTPTRSLTADALMSCLAIFLLMGLMATANAVAAATVSFQGGDEAKQEEKKDDAKKEGEQDEEQGGEQEEAKQDEAKDDAPPAKTALLEPKRKLTEKQKEDFKPLLHAFLSETRNLTAQKELLDKIAAFEKKEEYSPLGDVEAWRSLFEDHFYESIRKLRVNGAGRIQEDIAMVEVKGELFAFEYAYIIPRAYDHEKRWPVLICLHDEESDGKRYLDKLWQDGREMKDLCENFILVAPSMRNKTLEKKFREGRSVEKRVEWFDINFLRAIIEPFNSIRRQFHCDPERIFIEGTGTGADAAMQLAAYLPGRFAGVISRHGGMRDPSALPSLEGTKIMLLGRKESEFMEAGKRGHTELRDALQKLQDKNQDLVVITQDAEAQKSLSSKDMAYQKTDPVKEANPAVAEFISKTKLEAYPQTFRIVCGPKGFKNHPLAKITSSDVSDDNLLEFRLTFDREKNRLIAEGKSFFKFTVFLNDYVLDLDKPIEVVVNGVTLDNRTVQRDPKHLIADMSLKPFDYHQVLPALIRIEVPDEPAKKDEKKGDEEKKPEDASQKSAKSESITSGSGDKK